MKGKYENIFDITIEKIKNMNIEETQILAEELRNFLIESLSKTGGHLASNLGVVELTIALLKVFDFNEDKIIWDVGHQSYVYKILTGRAQEFSKIRKLGGISGFPKTEESPYDFFDTGHSSNSISVATGMIVARDINKEAHNVVAVIGDGSFTGGMAYEGLNNLGALKKSGIVILNDNGMSIGNNTGSINNHLSKLRTSKKYANFKHKMRDNLIKIPKIGKGMYKGLDNIKDTIKAGVVKGAIFEEMGFTYLGPVDGHDTDKLIKTFELAKFSEEPVLIHITTTKGKGYFYAEENPDKFHGISSFDVATGETINNTNLLSYSDVFGNKLTELAIKNPNIVAVTAAMIDGTGLSKFNKIFPERVFDVGIAEQHALTFASGMAKEGIKPYVAMYSSFLQRGYDQVIMDIALQKSSVVLCIDRAGCVGADGETHHGVFDISFLNHIPNLTIFAPSCKTDLEEAIERSLSIDGPVAIRYPRGEAISNVEIINPKKNIEVVIFPIGTMKAEALIAQELLQSEGVTTAVYPITEIKPLNKEYIINAISKNKLVVTVEDNMICGGLGQQITIALQESEIDCKTINIGWEDYFVQHGSQSELMKIYGLDGEGIKNTILKELRK